MHSPSADPADGSDALFGLDASGPELPVRTGRPSFRDSDAARRLLPVREIHAEPAAAASPRGRQIIARLPRARLVEVESHWGVPGLQGNEGNVARWVRVKGETLVLGERKSPRTRANGRCADRIAPGASNGCAMACAYCYVPRRKG